MSLNRKIVSLPTLKKRLSRLRRDGRTIAFTNGCFDIIHEGHVRYLESAKKKNRILVVGLNSDISIRKIKGANRPVVKQKARAAILAALSSVDYVTFFNEATPLRLISALKPDVLIKGADWRGKEVAGGEAVRSHGGKVEFIKYIPGTSTTKIIETIQKTCAK